MIYLILCILSSTGIFVIFKIIGHRQLPSFPVILINYFVATTTGLLLGGRNLSFSQLFHNSWIPVSILIGFFFIVMFFLVARSSSVAGISVTTVASKMSVVFPIVFSMSIDPGDNLTLVKSLAILAALTGVLLTVYRPGIFHRASAGFIIPFILFVGMGMVDSLVKFAQYRYVGNDDRAAFSAILFLMAFLTGILCIPFIAKGSRSFKNKSVWLWGLLLGLVNFGSIYFMVSALNYVNPAGNRIDSSVIFGTNNIGIVTLSVMAGMLFFRERLNPVNWMGIVISLISLLLFTISVS